MIFPQFRQNGPRSTGLVGVGTFCLVALSASAACIPDRDAPAIESPYLGYTIDPGTGEPKLDRVWHRAVRQLKANEGAPAFEFKNRPGIRFTSIETIDLGGGVEGFVAERNGCMQLFNGREKPMATPLFKAIQAEAWGPDILGVGRVLLQLKFEDSYRWASFDRGRLLAVSPRPYLYSYSGSSLETRHLPPYLINVASSFTNGHGLVDLRTLKEVLLPEWSGVTGVGVYGDTQPTRYLVAARSGKHTLFPLEGGSPLLDGMSSIEVVHNWLPPQPGRPVINNAAMFIWMEGETGCRLLDMRLRPLIAHLVPVAYGHCNTQRMTHEQKYWITESEGETVVAYRVEPEGWLRWLSSTPGKLEFAHRRTGLMVVSTQSRQNTVYRVYFADGKRAREEIFTGFQHLGCGFLRVELDGRWLSLFADGRTSTKLYYPFSC